MKFSSLTLALLFASFLFAAFSLSTDIANVKKAQAQMQAQKTTALKNTKATVATVAKAQVKTVAKAAAKTTVVAKKTVAAKTTGTAKTATNVFAKKVQAKVANFAHVAKIRSRTRAAALYVAQITPQGWTYQGPEPKSDLSKLEKVQSNRRYQGARNMSNEVFSSGPALSVAKLLYQVLNKTFQSEAKAAYQAFTATGTLIATDISQGFADNNWKITGTLQDLGALYYGTYHVNGTGNMNELEFTYMMIDATFAYNLKYDCKNCFQSMRTQIKKLFTFVDCDSKGFVEAINLFDVFKQMAGTENLKTTDVNDWLLKEDYRQIGRLDSKQFAEGVLKSVWEITYLEGA